jgi:hypothetical protein
VGGAVHLDDVVDGGVGAEGGEAFREAVADGRVLGPVGRGQGRRQFLEGQFGAVGGAVGLLAPGVGQGAGVVGGENVRA